MILNDFTEPKLKFSNEQLDTVLAELCGLVIAGQQDNPDFNGMVAAAVLDPKGRLVTGVNYLYGNYRIHGERAAIDRYEAEYGELPKGSIVITTLSPCSEKMSSRYEESCTDLLNAKGVKLAYCGYKDPTQDDRNKFTVIVTDNGKIKELCKQFADTFLDDDLCENFADGKVKGKSRPGRVKRAGASCNGSITDLRKRAKNSSGERAKMYHWCANMKSGKKKKTNEAATNSKITSADILQFNNISSEVKVRMLEELHLTGSPSLFESIEQSTIDTLKKLRKEFSSKLVIGNQYIPVYIMGFDDKFIVHDIEGNSPPAALAQLLTLVGIAQDSLTFKDPTTNKTLKYPDDIVGKNAYSCVIATDSVDQYKKLCIWLKIKHSISMPAAKKEIDEVITNPNIKTKGASTANLVNGGRPVPAGQEAKLLGSKVGRLGAYEVYKYDQGGDSAYSVFDPQTRISQLTVSGHNKPNAFEIFGIYAGPQSPVKAADLYAWLVKKQGLTLLSDRQQSPGGQRVWQDLEQRYGRSVNVYAFNMKTNQPINTGADDPESTHGTRGDTAQNVRLVAAPK